jgi:hypothetical protein
MTNGNDKAPKARHEKEDAQGKLKRDRGLALFLARSRARDQGLPLPKPEDIGPAAFVLLSPDMTREQKIRNVVATLARCGITVHQCKAEDPGTEGSS